MNVTFWYFSWLHNRETLTEKGDNKMKKHYNTLEKMLKEQLGKNMMLHTEMEKTYHPDNAKMEKARLDFRNAIGQNDRMFFITIGRVQAFAYALALVQKINHIKETK